MRYSKKIVLLVVLLNSVFVSAIIYLLLRNCPEPTALITAWFSFTTIELWTLAGITKEKVRGEASNENSGNKSHV